MLPDHTPGLHKVICNDVALINAVDLGALLGYANNGSTLPLLIRKNWGEQLIVDQDFLILRGAELDYFQSACADVGLLDFCKHQQQAFLLTPSGVHFVLSRSQKPLNPALRAWLLGDELQRIENQVCSALGPEPEPRADHFAWHTTRDLLVRTALLKGPFESASSRMMALIQRKNALDAWLQWHFKHDRITEASFLPVLTMFEAAVNLMCGQLPACAPIGMALGGERLT